MEKRNIVTYDVETTGLNPKEDFIIQLSLAKIDSTTFEVLEKKNWYVKPIHKYEISQGAFEAHGLTKEFIEKNGVNLKDIAPEIIEFFKDCDVLSFNGNTFDNKFLAKDLAMVGYEFDFAGRVFYDAYALEVRLQPRTLGATYKKYTGKEMEGAHDSMSDVLGTVEVFKNQLSQNNLTLEEVASYPENQVISPENSIRYANQADGKTVIVFAFGKYKDSEVVKIAKEDPSYVNWWSQNVASRHTLKFLHDYVRKNRK